MGLKNYITRLIDEGVRAKLNEIAPLVNASNKNSSGGLAKVTQVKEGNKIDVTLADGTILTDIFASTSRPTGIGSTGIVVDGVYTS